MSSPSPTDKDILQSPISILRGPAPVIKKLRRSVSFLDDIGKPLVECHDVPKITYDEDLRGRPKYEATKGKYISMFTPPAPTFNWNLIDLDSPLIRYHFITSQSFLTEQRRLVGLGIVTPSLFGTFEAIDDPELFIDSAINAYQNPAMQIPMDGPKTNVPASQIRNLPLPGRRPFVQRGTVESAMESNRFPPNETQQAEPEPRQNVYEQLHEGPHQEYIYIAQMGESSKTQESTQRSSPDKMNSLLSLMEQLKEKGFMPRSEPAAPNTNQYSTNDNNNINNNSSNNDYDPVYPVQRNAVIPPNELYEEEPPQMNINYDRDSNRRQRWQPGYRINEHCTYYLYKDGGCSRGDMCRFLHDDNERQKRRIEKNGLSTHSSSPSQHRMPPPPPSSNMFSTPSHRPHSLHPSSRQREMRDENWRRQRHDRPPPPSRFNAGFDRRRSTPPTQYRRYSRSPPPQSPQNFHRRHFNGGDQTKR